MRDSTLGSVGFNHMRFTIEEVVDGMAYGRDNFGRNVMVPTITLPGKGPAPTAGEDWVITKKFGVWAFEAILTNPARSVLGPVMATVAPTASVSTKVGSGFAALSFVGQAIPSPMTTVIQNMSGIDQTLSLQLKSAGGRTSPMQLSFDQGVSYQTVGQVTIASGGTANIMVPFPAGAWFRLSSPGDIAIAASYTY